MPMRTTMMIGTLALLMALSATPAHAQDQRLRVSLGSAATAGALEAEMALTASVGYRFMDRISFEIEVTEAESGERFGDQRFRAGAFGDSRMPQPGNLITRGADILGQPRSAGGSMAIGNPFDLTRGFAATSLNGLRGDADGRTFIATLGFRYELPTQVGRLRPYVSAGLGIARTDEEFTVSIAPTVAGVAGFNAGASQEIDASHTGLATGAGVGASIRVYKELSLDVDARYFRLDRDRHLGRFGGGVSYRF